MSYLSLGQIPSNVTNIIFEPHLDSLCLASNLFFHPVVPLGKFDIARLHGHLGSRGLQQNVVRGWHFKEILAKI